MFLRKNIPDTLRPVYNERTRTPDYLNWGLYKSSGFLNIYSLIADTIIRNKNAPESYLNESAIEVAYMPMKTPTYNSIPPIAIDGLS
jgi:hypothetical protein